MPYLDYNATTPVGERVLNAMMPLFAERFGNPSSVHHGTGRTAAAMVEDARKQVAGMVGMNASDVIFTSSATEANNLALAGFRKGLGRPVRMLAGATEHKSVLETCRALQEDGSTLTIIRTTSNGTADLDDLEDKLSEGVDIVSVMAANSETGVIHPVEDIAKLVREHGAMMHCDATQAVGKIPFDAGELDIDIVTFSSHKIYGPKGCGALVGTREARRKIACMIHGGGQERDMRSGTLNVPAIVGFGEACRIALTDGLADSPRQRSLRDRFERRLADMILGVSVNGAGAERLPNTSNIRIRGALADAVLARLRSVEVSTGSACSSSAMEPSHVLVAMGLDRNAADESVRVSVGRHTVIEDVELAASEIAQAAEAVRCMEARQEAVQ